MRGFVLTVALAATACGSRVEIYGGRDDKPGLNGAQNRSCAAGTVEPVVRASGQFGPTSVTTDATHVYWAQANINGDALVRAPKIEGGVERLGPGAGTTGIVVDDTHAYWITFDGTALHGALRRAPKAGGPGELLRTALEGAAKLGHDASQLYWLEQGLLINDYVDGAVMTMPKDGGEATVLAGPRTQLSDLAVGGGYIAWTNRYGPAGAAGPFPGAVERMPIAGGAPQVIFEGINVTGVAVDADATFWSAAADENGSYPTAIWTVEHGGGEPRIVARGGGFINQLQPDGSCLYFYDMGGPSLGRLPRTGGELARLTAVGSSTQFVVDGADIFFAEYHEDRVMRAAKP